MMKVPELLNSDIAYLTGFIMGDGHLCFREDKHEYMICCSGNLNDEKEFYVVIKSLFERLFDVEPIIKYSHYDHTIYLKVYSNIIFGYFKDIGIPVGSKCDKIKMPDIFKKSENLTVSFLQGFADADFSLTLKRRYKNIPYYPVIVGASKSKEMIEEYCVFLKSNGFTFSKEIDKVKYDKRFGYTKISLISIYGHDKLVKWMNVIGFRNEKMLIKFKLWQVRNKNNKRAQNALSVLKNGSEGSI
jgi:hypothetical protein